MALATVTTRVETKDPSVEVVQLTVSDGETYTSRKFQTIQAASLTLNVANAGFTDEIASVSFAAGVATIELIGTDTTDLLATLVLYGVR